MGGTMQAMPPHADTARAAPCPPRIVIDTNVLLDLWVFDDVRVRPLRAALAAGRLQPMRSADTDAELIDVLGRPQFALAADRQCAVLQDWQALAHAVPRVFAAPWHCTDRRDQKFLDLAHTARAAVLLTKDKAVLKVNRRAQRDGVLIQTPEAWVAALQVGGMAAMGHQ
jgi:predicted nucleic acid-binding protein